MRVNGGGVQVLITSHSSRWLEFFAPFLFSPLFLLREKERSESGKGKFKKLSRLLVSYQEADPAKLEEDTSTPPALHSFHDPPQSCICTQLPFRRFLNVTVCQALFRTNIPQCPIFKV